MYSLHNIFVLAKDTFDMKCWQGCTNSDLSNGPHVLMAFCSPTLWYGESSGPRLNWALEAAFKVRNILVNSLSCRAELRTWHRGKGHSVYTQFNDSSIVVKFESESMLAP